MKTDSERAEKEGTMTKEQMVETIQAMERELSNMFSGLESGLGVCHEETKLVLAAWAAVRRLRERLGIEPCRGDGQ